LIEAPVDVGTIPGFIVHLHRMARIGAGHPRMSASKRFVMFDVRPPMDEIWPELQDAQRVILIYKEKPLERA
jgi:hypothetical protein